MSTKVNEQATCPYCEHTEWHVFHYGANTLHCKNCNKEFKIKLDTKIEIRSAKIYDKQCIACDNYYTNAKIVDGKCPECGYDGFNENKYKVSEFEY